MEIDQDDGLWDGNKLLWVLSSMNDMHAHYIGDQDECNMHQIWRAFEKEGRFWNGHPSNRDSAEMWSVCRWCGPKPMMCMEFGCLMCGYRTQKLMPWRVGSTPSERYIYKERFIVALQCLFGSC
jgi:hypothetical protein